MKSNLGQRHNALKHGAFVDELLILDEKAEDFDELHEACISDLRPSGLLEEEVGLCDCQVMWRKKRIERLVVTEAEWLREHSSFDEVDRIFRLARKLKKGTSCALAWGIIHHLPQGIRDIITSEFELPQSTYDDDWIAKLHTKLEYFASLYEQEFEKEQETLRHRGETAGKIRSSRRVRRFSKSDLT